MCTPGPSRPAAAAWLAPLPPGRELAAAADHRLAAAGQPVDGDQHVLVQAADDGDGHRDPPQMGARATVLPRGRAVPRVEPADAGGPAAHDRTDEPDEIRAQFAEAVNMTAGRAGEVAGQPTSRRRSGRRAAARGSRPGTSRAGASSSCCTRRRPTSPTTTYAHMRKVHGYVARHLAQEPEHEDVGDLEVALLADELGPRPR